MTANREYLVSRYGPELTQTTSQINRLTATVEELHEKVGKIIRSTPPPKECITPSYKRAPSQ